MPTFFPGAGVNFFDRNPQVHKTIVEIKIVEKTTVDKFRNQLWLDTSAHEKINNNAAIFIKQIHVFSRFSQCRWQLFNRMSKPFLATGVNLFDRKVQVHSNYGKNQ